MKLIRLILSVAIAVLLTAGYLANEYAWFQGDSAAYVAKVDQTPIRVFATLIFFACILLAFLPEKEDAA